jgi:hypothetical protein
LWYDDRDVSFLQEDVLDAADIRQRDASTMRTLVDGGFEPDSVIQAVTTGDMTLLTHSGSLSVQLQAPGSLDAVGQPVEVTDVDQARDLAEIIQKLYLGVGKVVTSDEARQIINKAGGSLSIPNGDVPFAMPGAAYESPT